MEQVVDQQQQQQQGATTAVGSKGTTCTTGTVSAPKTIPKAAERDKPRRTPTVIDDDEPQGEGKGKGRTPEQERPSTCTAVSKAGDTSSTGKRGQGRGSAMRGGPSPSIDSPEPVLRRRGSGHPPMSSAHRSVTPFTDDDGAVPGVSSTPSPAHQQVGNIRYTLHQEADLSAFELALSRMVHRVDHWYKIYQLVLAVLVLVTLLCLTLALLLPLQSYLWEALYPPPQQHIQEAAGLVEIRSPSTPGGGLEGRGGEDLSSKVAGRNHATPLCTPTVSETRQALIGSRENPFSSSVQEEEAQESKEGVVVEGKEEEEETAGAGGVQEREQCAALPTAEKIMMREKQTPSSRKRRGKGTGACIRTTVLVSPGEEKGTLETTTYSTTIDDAQPAEVGCGDRDDESTGSGPSPPSLVRSLGTITTHLTVICSILLVVVHIFKRYVRLIPQSVFVEELNSRTLVPLGLWYDQYSERLLWSSTTTHHPHHVSAGELMMSAGTGGGVSAGGSGWSPNKANHRSSYPSLDASPEGSFSSNAYASLSGVPSPPPGRVGTSGGGGGGLQPQDDDGSLSFGSFSPRAAGASVGAASSVGVPVAEDEEADYPLVPQAQRHHHHHHQANRQQGGGGVEEEIYVSGIGVVPVGPKYTTTTLQEYLAKAVTPTPSNNPSPNPQQQQLTPSGADSESTLQQASSSASPIVPPNE